MQINSKTNNIIKYIKSLEDKKFRTKNDAFVIEGVKIVNEMINSKGEYPFESIVYSKELLAKGSIGEDMLDLICKMEKDTNLGFVMLEVSKDIFEYLSDTIAPQGVLAVAKRNLKHIADLIKENDGDSSYIILDNVKDSGNLGTIIRSANSFNVKNVICVEGTADVYSPKVVRSAMGAILNTNICYVSKANMEMYAGRLKDLGYILVGTKMDASINIRDKKNMSKNIFVMGNEANGLSPEIENICDEFVKIPMEESQESLNVGVAASIVMYEKYIRG